MARELTAEQEAAVASDDFSYYDTVEIRLPYAVGDAAPIVIRATTVDEPFGAGSGIEITSPYDFSTFTYRAFTAAPDRPPTTTEEDAWIAALEAAFATSQAALLTEAKSRINGLFLSAGYLARLRTDDQFIEDLYLTFLNRVSDPGGKLFWLTALASTTRDALRVTFQDSGTEFSGRVAALNQPADFEPDVRDMGAVTLSDGRAQDGADLGLQNTQNTYSVLLAEATRRLHPAPALIKRAIRIADETYEADTLVTGFARFDSVDGQNAKITVTSDMSRRGLDVIVPITQRCRHVYKGPGCESPDTSPTCSRIFDDADNGCAAKDPAPRITDVSVTNNQPSFGGVPPLNVTAEATPTSGLPPVTRLPSNGWPTDYDVSDPRLRNMWRGYEP